MAALEFAPNEDRGSPPMGAPRLILIVLPPSPSPGKRGWASAGMILWQNSMPRMGIAGPRPFALAAIYLCLVVLVSATAAPNAAPVQRGEIRGQVVDHAGKPVGRAIVRIIPDTPGLASEHRGSPGRPQPPGRATRVETREDGGFTALGVTGSSFSLRVEAKGYAPFTQKGVAAGAVVNAVLERGFTLSGAVLDISTHKPLTGATVLAWDEDAARFGEDSCSRATSEPDGRFLLADLPRGALTLMAKGAGYVPAKTGPVTVPVPRTSDGAPGPEPVLALERGARITGRVLRQDGKPADGASVQARLLETASGHPPQDDDLPAVTSDASGAFTIDGLPAGRYRLRAEKKGLSPVERGPIDVRTGSTLTGMDIRFESGATLTVRLVDPMKKPVRGLSVELLEQGPGSGRRPPVRSEARAVPARQISPGEGGKYTIDHLDPGTYTVRLLVTDWGDIEKENVRLNTGETTDLGTIVVHEGRSFSGLVTDSSGAPVRGAEVTASWRDGSRTSTRSATTGADGRYRIGGIAVTFAESVVARAKGFAPSRRDGANAGDTAVDFVLDRGGAIVGRVEITGGGAITGLRVVAYRESTRDDDRGSAGAEGREASGADVSGAFRVEDLEPGTYTVEIAAGGHSAVKKTGIQVQAGQDADAGTVMFASGLSVHGRVLAGRDDAPVAGATIVVALSRLPMAGADLLPASATGAVSGADGSFSIEGLQSGILDMTIDHPRFSPSHLRVNLTSDQEMPDLIVRLYRGGTLTGLVFDSQKQPVPEVHVLIFDGGGVYLQTAVTDADGRYTVASLSPGSYQVMRQGDGGGLTLGIGAKPAVIAEDETTEVDLDTGPRIFLSGKILRGDAPLANTTLSLIAVGTNSTAVFKSTRSDAEGAYRIGLDHGGPYQAFVSIAGANGPGGSSTTNLTVPEQPEVQQDIVFAVKAISGHVTGSDGTAIKGATVTALRDGSGAADPPRQFLATTGQDGAYRVEAIDPGTYRVTARASGYQAGEVYPLAVNDDTPEPTVDLSLDRGWTLRGRVVDPQGRGIGGALIVVAAPGNAESGFLPANSDATGAFRITAPTDGAVNVTAIPTGYAPARQDNVTAPSGDTPQEIELQAGPGGSVRIRAVHHDTEPVAGVQAVLQPDPLFPGCDYVADHNRPKPTGGDGTSIVTLLAPGDYIVTVTGRAHVNPVRVTVTEGQEIEARIDIP